MQNSTISSVNTKGQLVLPKFMRDELGIDSKVPLQISLRGQQISIVPIEKVVTKVSTVDTFQQMLKLTHGAWGPETEEDKQLEKKRRKKELKEAKKNKQQW